MRSSAAVSLVGGLLLGAILWLQIELPWDVSPALPGVVFTLYLLLCLLALAINRFRARSRRHMAMVISAHGERLTTRLADFACGMAGLAITAGAHGLLNADASSQRVSLLCIVLAVIFLSFRFTLMTLFQIRQESPQRAHPCRSNPSR